MEWLTPLEFDDVDPKPVIWELIILTNKHFFTFLLSIKGFCPSLNRSVDFLNLSDKNCHVIRTINRKALKLSSSHLDFLIEGIDS